MSENTEESKSIVPLVNFSSDVDSVQLSKSLSLRRVDSGELEGLMELTPDYDSLKGALLDVEYVIEKKLTIERHELSMRDWSEESRHVQDIVLALRLLGAGDVEALTAFKLDAGGSYAISKISPTVQEGPSYFLKRKETDVFVKLWKKLQSVDEEKPYLRFPLDQFSRAFEENFSEAMIIDFMTAFELLVFYGVEKPPRPYGEAIGIAIGMLLGKNQKERIEIEKNLKKAYEMRNSIVHGHLRKRLQKYDDKRGTQLLFKMEDYLRRALKRFLEE